MSTSSDGCDGSVGANLDPGYGKHRWAAPKGLLGRSDVRARVSIFAHSDLSRPARPGRGAAPAGERRPYMVERQGALGAFACCKARGAETTLGPAASSGRRRMT